MKYHNNGVDRQNTLPLPLLYIYRQKNKILGLLDVAEDLCAYVNTEENLIYLNFHKLGCIVAIGHLMREFIQLDIATILHHNANTRIAFQYNIYGIHAHALRKFLQQKSDTEKWGRLQSIHHIVGILYIPNVFCIHQCIA